MNTTKHTPIPWATDGRFVVQEVDGRSFWLEQPFIADFGISSMSKPAGTPAADARYAVHCVNCFQDLYNALFEMIESCELSPEESAVIAKAQAAIQKARIQ